MNTFTRPRLSSTQAILILVACDLVTMGYIISLTNYNHDIGVKTQQQIIDLVNNQGNLSTSQRQTIINEFEAISGHGGLATQDGQKAMLNNLTNLIHQSQMITNNTSAVAHQIRSLLQGSVKPTLAAKVSIENQELLKDIIGNLTLHNNNK